MDCHVTDVGAKKTCHWYRVTFHLLSCKNVQVLMTLTQGSTLYDYQEHAVYQEHVFTQFCRRAMNEGNSTFFEGVNTISSGM